MEGTNVYPLRMPWALEGAATPPPSLTFMVGKAGSWCQERKSPLLPGANADALVSHHRLERGWAGRWRGAAGRREEGSCVYTQGRGRGWGAKTGERPSREKAAIVHAGQLHGGPEASSQEESKSFLLCAGRRAKEKEEERLRRRDWGRGGEKRERRKEHRRDGGGSGALPVLDRIQIHPLILQPFNEQLLRGRPLSSTGILERTDLISLLQWS